MRYFSYYIGLPSFWENLFLFLIIWIIYFLLIYKNNFSKSKKILLWVIFIYLYFLIIFSFFPIKFYDYPVKIDILSKMDFNIFSLWNDYILKIPHLFLLFPAWFFINFFEKNYKNIFIFWILLSLTIEIIQLFIIFIWTFFWFFISKTFSLNDIIINFLWFTIWVFIFIIFEKLNKKIRF